jgi:zona occludens toxin
MAITLVTGLNGTFKTATSLWDFLHNPAYAGRPKFALPVKDFDPAKHGVLPLDAEGLKGWWELPEGAVIFVDEAQKYFPTRGRGEPPKWIQAIAEHRHQGKDFILTTPTPMMIDTFVRALAKPHFHMLRPWNMGKPTRWAFEQVETDPTSTAARGRGMRSPVKLDKQVFSVYTSTVLDTHQSRFPKKVLYGGIAVVIGLIFCIGWFLHWQHQKMNGVPLGATAASASGRPLSSGFGAVGGAVTHVWQTSDMTPRVAGMPWTAPVYDGISQPTDFPRIAGCMVGHGPDHPCQCYSQQGTPLDETEQMCLSIVKKGIFDPWQSGRRNQEVAVQQGSQVQQPQLAQASPQEAPSPAIAAIDQPVPAYPQLHRIPKPVIR